MKTASTTEELGTRVREMRGIVGLTMRQLAERADISASLLCDIENAKARPSVRTLLRIADALGVTPDFFFTENVNDAVIINQVGRAAPTPQGEKARFQLLRAGDRPSIDVGGGITWQALTPGKTSHTQFYEIVYGPGTSSGDEMLTHSGSEFGLIHEGTLTLDLGFEQHVLEAGDSVFFESTTPHRLSNKGDVPMRALWVDIY